MFGFPGARLGHRGVRYPLQAADRAAQGAGGSRSFLTLASQQPPPGTQPPRAWRAPTPPRRR